MTKSKKQDHPEEQVNELTADLQRVRADFENYRKRAEQEKEMARAQGKVTSIVKLLPVIDNIERAVAHTPQDLADNTWAKGVAGLVKNLDKSLGEMGVARIDAKPGMKFDPNLHEAIQFDDDAEGDTEVIAEELQAGYTIGGEVARHSLVKVTRA